MNIILASSSPRRQELLKLITKDFKICPAEIEEIKDESLPMEKLVESLSKQKAEAVFKDNEDSIVIGSDTMVFCEGRPLGKPEDEEDAFKTLKMLSGRTHQVATGVTIMAKGCEDTFSSVADVKFYPLSDEEIKSYIETKEPMDKAGSYGINGRGSLFIEGIKGDFYTVVGLPVAKLYRHLKNFKALLL